MKPNLWVLLGGVVSFAIGMYALPMPDDVHPKHIAQVHRAENVRLASVEWPVK